MLQDGEWGSYAEIVALAEVLQRSFFIFSWQLNSGEVNNEKFAFGQLHDPPFDFVYGGSLNAFQSYSPKTLNSGSAPAEVTEHSVVRIAYVNNGHYDAVFEHPRTERRENLEL
jgi:hypothetical protein